MTDETDEPYKGGRLHPPNHDITFRSTFLAANDALAAGVGAKRFVWFGKTYYTEPHKHLPPRRAPRGR